MCIDNLYYYFHFSSFDNFLLDVNHHRYQHKHCTRIFHVVNTATKSKAFWDCVTSSSWNIMGISVL